ncbi:MAG: c-type cytochrome [Woeseiaceae bacterium]|nr:c-type cytochrome [Woeseiaceae bacterium]
MNRYTPIMLVLWAAGCGQAGMDSPAGTRPGMTADTTIDSGIEAYERVCAGCHEEGLNGAPKTGDREAWAGRSELWEAVLFEHATDGYLGMPAKGGAQDLDEATVERAVEYMMSLTYPERNSP